MDMLERYFCNVYRFAVTDQPFLLFTIHVLGLHGQGILYTRPFFSNRYATIRGLFVTLFRLKELRNASNLGPEKFQDGDTKS